MKKCQCINKQKGNSCQSNALIGKKTCSRHVNQTCSKTSTRSTKETNRQKETIKQKQTSSSKKRNKKETVKQKETSSSRKRTVDQPKKKETFTKKTKQSNQKTNALVTMKSIYEITFPQFRFSEWIFEKYSQDSIFESMQHAKVFYHKSKNATLSTVMKLVKEREPVNIAREKGFDVTKMQKTFGWDTAFYDRYFQKHKTLAPNIAVFTPALLLTKGQYLKINILNAIGLAFDSKNQSDYKYFFGPNNAFKNVGEAKKQVLIFYRQLISKVYQCAKIQKLKTVVFCAIGMGFFQEFYPGDMFLEIFMVAFQYEARTELINTLFMGFSSTQKSQMKRIFPQFKDIGFFPECTNKVILKETLFLSPADPLAYFSNGAKGDKSLEGFIGTHTSIAIVGNGIANPSLSLESNYVALKS